MDGQVRNMNGKSVAGAVVDLWHANTLGGYSFFGPSQPKYNLRRRIETDAEGRYTCSVRSCSRATPAHRTARPRSCSTSPAATATVRRISISRFCAKLSRATTQIKIDGDAYLHDDFAFATRNGLIPEVRRSTDPAAINARGLNAPFAEITFDFVLHPESAAAPNTVVTRPHAEAA
jgi:catechol 1,2-dioxygenase